MTFTEKINFVKKNPNQIFFFKEGNNYRLYNENVYWFCKKLHPIKVNKSSIKCHRLFYLYGCFSVDKLFYLKNEYPTDFKIMKTHAYGFSIKGNIDLIDYEEWYDQY